MDSVKDSANKKSSMAGLSPIEEVDLVEHFHSDETINKHCDLKRQNKHHDLKRQTQGRKMETSPLPLDTTGV